jgi:hypothetical protein
MKKFKLSIVIFLLAVISMTSISSYAATEYARSIIYFNSSDQIIGQQILYCTNTYKHAGTIDASNPYRIEEEFGCGDPIVTCTTTISGTTCSQTGTENSSDIVYFKSALGYSQSQYCSSVTTSSTAPFFEHPTCGLPAPSTITLLDPYSSGWQ